MTFRRLNQLVLLPTAQALMILGIVALCQPWVEVLHRYGLTITLIGLVGFMVTGKIAPDRASPAEEDWVDEALDVLEINRDPPPDVPPDRNRGIV